MPMVPKILAAGTIVHVQGVPLRVADSVIVEVDAQSWEFMLEAEQRETAAFKDRQKDASIHRPHIDPSLVPLMLQPDMGESTLHWIGVRAKHGREAYEQNDQDSIAHHLSTALRDIDNLVGAVKAWRGWAQFVYLNGGPAVLDDYELRAAVCQAQDEREATARMRAAACMDCGASVTFDATLPEDQWRLIHKNLNGLLCVMCISKRAERLPGAVALRVRIEFAGKQDS